MQPQRERRGRRRRLQRGARPVSIRRGPALPAQQEGSTGSEGPLPCLRSAPRRPAWRLPRARLAPTQAGVPPHSSGEARRGCSSPPQAAPHCRASRVVATTRRLARLAFLGGAAERFQHRQPFRCRAEDATVGCAAPHQRPRGLREARAPSARPRLPPPTVCRSLEPGCTPATDRSPAAPAALLQVCRAPIGRARARRADPRAPAVGEAAQLRSPRHLPLWPAQRRRWLWKVPCRPRCLTTRRAICRRGCLLGLGPLLRTAERRLRRRRRLRGSSPPPSALA